MSDVQSISGGIQPFTRKPNTPVKGRTKRPNAALTRKVRLAIDGQAFEALTRAEAAAKAGLSESALYQALRKPAVLAYWNECLHVLRTGERARNIHRLAEIRDQNDNHNAAVQAVKVLEQTAEQRAISSASRVVTPGVMVIINNSGKPASVDETVIQIGANEAFDSDGNER